MDNSQLEQAAEIALQHAKSLGATAAEVGVSQNNGLSLTVRKGDVETLEYNNDKGLGITVYFGQAKASSSTSDFRTEAIYEAVDAACNIAKHTQEDEFAGLANPEQMATEFPDLSLYHPWDLDADKAIDIAMECEQAGFDVDPKISNSEGANVSSYQGGRVYANSHGFVGSTNSSQHSISCTLIADDDNDGMQRDYWYSHTRDAADLESAVSVGQRAAQNAVKRLNARAITTGHYPIIFAADIAPSLFHNFINAIRGGGFISKIFFFIGSFREENFP